jgi:ABC-type multidrug transport system ATPase subunit/prephenate dehydratase
MRRYGYLGVPGAYGEEALLTYLGGAVEPVGLPSLPEVLRAIETGEIDGGVFPVENASTGPIHDVVNLLETTELDGEKFWLPVQHCLLALPGQTVGDLRQVLSHPQALAECAEYARTLGVELLSMSDAAASARYIAEERLSGVAAVASARAAALYHLEVLARGIQRDPRNLTRYVVLRRGTGPRRGAGVGGDRMLWGLAPAGRAVAMEEGQTVVLSHPAMLSWTGGPVPPASGGWRAPEARGLALVGPLAEAPSAAGEEAGAQGRAALPLALVPSAQGFRRNLPAPAGSLAAPVRRSPRQGAPALLLRDVCKAYGRGKKRRLALDHLSLRVEHGEIFGLLGPNGAGKTTTINLICGLSLPSAGTIGVLGFDVRRDRRRILRCLGAVPQETALYEELTALENLKYHAALYGVPRRLQAQRIQEMLELVGLTPEQGRRVKTYSGGMKRRLLLARALLHDPELLYLDEPTLGVDVQSRRALWDYILGLSHLGKTVLLTTNLMEEAQALCDRIAIIDRGKLVALDTPAHLKQRYGASVIEVDLAGPISSLEPLRALAGVEAITSDPRRTHLAIRTRRASEVVSQLRAQFPDPVTLIGITVREPHLDDVFLSLTGAALRD